MKLENVIFLGGGPRPLPSAQIRCVDIALKLGCARRLGVRTAEEIPEQYTAFVCVKPDLPLRELEKLSKRGRVIWDIIDVPPPRDFVSHYIVSTAFTRDLFSPYGKVAVLPHYHCNFDGEPNPPDSRRPAWIGARQWQPKLQGFEYDLYFVEGMRREDVVAALRRTGLGLNFRSREVFFAHACARLERLVKTLQERRRIARDIYNFHLAVNSGIKLINCLGFGIPSVSADEPAYREIGEDCTVFSTPARCARWVRALQEDDELYLELRRRALKKAREFHIDAVAEKYRKFFQSL